MGPFNWDAPAASQESISHQYSETFFRQFIAIRPPGIVFFSIDLIGLTQLNGKKAKKLGARRANARRAPNFLVIPRRIA
jgi:hypothetical protein